MDISLALHQHFTENLVYFFPRLLFYQTFADGLQDCLHNPFQQEYEKQKHGKEMQKTKPFLFH